MDRSAEGGKPQGQPSLDRHIHLAVYYWAGSEFDVSATGVSYVTAFEEDVDDEYLHTKIVQLSKVEKAAYGLFCEEKVGSALSARAFLTQQHAWVKQPECVRGISHPRQ